MTQILLVGHGGFATGLLETAAMLAGESDRVRAIDFPVGTGVDALTADVRSAIDAIAGDGEDAHDSRVLLLADVVGGSPARVALGEALAGRAEVVTGANLPMLLDLLFAPEPSDAATLARRAVEAARSGIRDLGAEIRAGGALA